MVIYRLLGIIAGFVFGVFALIALYYLIELLMELFGAQRARVRVPIVIFVLPIVGALFGFRLGPIFAGFIAGEGRNFKDEVLSSWQGRLALIAPTLWSFAVIGYVFLFSPYGRYMGDDDYVHMAKVVSFPIVMMWLAIWAARFVISGKAGKE